VRDAVREFVEAIQARFDDQGEQTRERIKGAVLFITLCAFGDAVIGAPLRDMLDSDAESGRRVVAQLLATLVT
jgi:hypothetical protein